MITILGKVLKNINLRLFNRRVDIKGSVNLHWNTKIIVSNDGKMSLGNGLSTFNNVHLTANGGNLSIGSEVFFNRNCLVICMDSIKIGNHCLFGPNVCVYDHDHKFGVQGVQNQYNTSPIVIEDGCWIGANAVILRGSYIGKGCVIGAGTVIKGRVPPHSIVTNERKLIIKPIEE